MGIPVGESGLLRTAAFRGHVAPEYLSEPIRPIPDPVDDSSELVLLGKSLFHDKRLSADNSTSCASCHPIAKGGMDGLVASIGIGDQVGSLNAPTVLNSSLSSAQFWDGRAQDLTEQAEGPIHNPIEMGSNWEQVIGKLEQDPLLVERFRTVFGSGPSVDGVLRSIVAYENALLTVNSPFDRFLRGEKDAIAPEAYAGYGIFKEVGCISCHQGRAVGGNMFQEFGVMREFGDHFDAELDSNQGRFNATGRPADRYRFKVPALRNVTRTAPYFHDGSASTLEEAVQIMADYQLGLELEPEQLRLVILFLQSLDGRLPGHVQ